ncbi:MAG: 1,4-beta-xylanase [Kiritimatiellaceae bacterium]|nr:1,4-beta-xylanase [Kiritimatiellaceae bacterium]
MRKFLTYIFIFFIPILSGCAEASLHDQYADAFLIGVAVGSDDVGHPYRFPMKKNAKEWALIHKEFNSLTAENLMKMQYMHPKPDLYYFDDADEFIDEAERHGHAVVGHTLVWHAMAPSWVFKDQSGGTVSADELQERMKEHIYTIAGRYRGRIAYWDVVNEAVKVKKVKDETGKLVEKAALRESPWLTILGEAYLEDAFKFAEKGDPTAKLLYNDFSMTNPKKAQFVADMCQDLRSKGCRVDGVGMQAHWHLEYPTVAEIQHALDIFRAASLRVHITELDLGILPRPSGEQDADISRNVELAERLNPYTEQVPAEVLEAQAKRYEEIFNVLYKNRDIVDRVTFWGLSDGPSWLNDWPVKGRTSHPLLFDRDLNPKPAYEAVYNVPSCCDCM